MDKLERNQAIAEEFKLIASEREATEKAYKYILSVMNQAVANKDINKLLSLIPYMESGEGLVCIRRVGEAGRILQMLHIIELEEKHSQFRFYSGCGSADELMDKYVRTLFALRRLLFKLSDESVNEAIECLLNEPVSAIALYILTQHELIIPSMELYAELLTILFGVWNEEERQLFVSLFRSQ